MVHQKWFTAHYYRTGIPWRDLSEPTHVALTLFPRERQRLFVRTMDSGPRHLSTADVIIQSYFPKSVLLLKEQKIKTLVLKLSKLETSQLQSLNNLFLIRANCSGLWPGTSGGKSGSGRGWNHSGRIHQVLPMYRRLSHGGRNQCNLWERWTLVWRQILLQTYVKMASPKLNDVLKDKFAC